MVPVGPQLQDALISCLERVLKVRDPTDPNAAVFFEVDLQKDKKNFWTYTVAADGESFIDPKPLPKWLRKKIEVSCSQGGECDPQRFVASLIRSAENIIDMINGGAESAVKDDSSAPDAKPPCHGTDEIDSDDPGCQICKFKVSCAAKTGADVPPDRVLKRKPAPTPEPEEESRPKFKRKPAPEPESEEEEEEEEEEAPKRKPESVQKSGGLRSLKRKLEPEPEPEEEKPKAKRRPTSEPEETPPPASHARKFKSIIDRKKAAAAAAGLGDEEVPY
jgi:hypothetical protein